MVCGFRFEIRVMLRLPVLLVLMGVGGNCDRVKFYANKNYEGFIEDYVLSGERGGRCRSFVSNSLDIKSLKTDRCIMLFGNMGCDIHYRQSGPLFSRNDSSYSLRVDADTPEITGTLNEGGTRVAHSFGPCSRERGGGPEVNVDFYSDTEYQGETTASFRDVQGCQNVNTAVGGKSRQISMDNHGHDIDLFEGENCTGQRRRVKAGSNRATKWIWDSSDHMAYFDIRSFRPANMKDSNNKLTASIYKFVFEKESQKMIDDASTEENEQLAPHNIFSNNESRPIARQYAMMAETSESMEVTRSPGYSDIETVKVEKGVQIEANTGVPLIDEGTIMNKLTDSFQYHRGSTPDKTSIENEETIFLDQQVIIQPCKECVISSFLKKVRNYPIKYTAYSRVTERAGRSRMSAQEVRSALHPQVKYLGDVDDYTVDTMVEGVMYAEYGISSFINVDCSNIADCVATPLKPWEQEKPLNTTHLVPLQKSRFHEKKNNIGAIASDVDIIELFESENFENLVKAIEITKVSKTGCYDLLNSDYARITARSVKTDRCIMLYLEDGCNKDSPSYSLRVEADQPTIIEFFGFGNQYASLSVCSRELEGGPEVDVDFYNDTSYRGSIVARFRDVCGCRNLEKSIWKQDISINNHGNSIDIFEGAHCTGQTRTLRAGISFESRNMIEQGGSWSSIFEVHSFRPTNNEYCVKLDASIYKFVFEDGTQEMIKNSTEEQVKLATDTFLRNNGAQSIVQEYSIAGKITQLLEITTSEGYSNMHQVKAEVSVSTEFITGLKWLAEEKIKVQITGGYQYQWSKNGSKTNKTTVANEETITVRQQITIQPCRECVASSFVKKAKNYPVRYTAYSWVTGKAGSQKMSAQEVKAALRPEVKYLGDVDAYTVDTKVEGVMFAEYGLSSYINVDCKKILDCVAGPPKPDVKNEHTTYVHRIDRST